MLAAAPMQGQNPFADTLRQETVTVRGFETTRPLLTTAAPIYVIGQKDLNRYPNTSLVPALNQSPGVRMEERSPGSYRLSVRGSLLRSPFGVRNIKVYLQGIPFTDAGGNTYMNLLDVNMMERIEIIKGPAGITYGAGTGGTLLLNEQTGSRLEKPGREWRASLNGGSYHSFGEHLRFRQQNKKTGIAVQQSHFKSKGYREHSSLRRDALMLQTTLGLNKKDEWNLLLLYGNLHYNTPGGIALEQMNQNPRLSRQRTATLPSAMEQKAGIYQQTLFSGLSHKHIFNKQWMANSSLFAAYTDFANPFITNYETRFEKSAGMRSVFNYEHPARKIKINAGFEAALTASQIANYGNRGGQKDTLQNKDLVNALQGFAFLQASAALSKKILFDAGFSLNRFAYRYKRVYAIAGNGKRTFNVQWLPRIALLYRAGSNFSVYGSISRGYSPPTIAEVRPDNQVLNTGLQPEAGTNAETGFRGSFLKGKLFMDFSAYHFQLKNTIVRRTANNGDFFVNAGSTKQNGIELYTTFVVYKGQEVAQIKLTGSFTGNHYRFGNYAVANAVFKGKKITGVPDRIILAGADIFFRNGIYLNATCTHTSSLPLTDDNMVAAQSFYLLGCRGGYRPKFKKTVFDFFLAGNNLLNELYSPGNDLNAAGGRYYNPGAKINFTVGAVLNME
jgi:iron complex outermembrane recepter protein